MAKKRRKQIEEEESYEFQMPEFDEEEYLRKEIRETKTLFITFFYASMIGVASWGLRFVDLASSVLLGFIAIVFLRHIYPLFKINTALLEKKQWGTNIIFYIFTWILIWIILTNPPFSDFQSPLIKSEGIYFGTDGNWTRLNETNDEISGSNQNVSINFTVRDNVDVDANTVRVVIMAGGSDVIHQGIEKIGKDKYAVQIRNGTQYRSIQYTIYAKDINNHESKHEGEFEFK
jgi:hypothetical protein